MKKRIIIVGGGFGGIYTAKYLKKYLHKENIEITIINKTNYFLFTPLLHEVATGGLSPLSIAEPIREILRHDNIKFVQATVSKVDTVSNKVVTELAEYHFDYIVISTGAETKFFDVPGAKENSFVLKNLSDALNIRDRIIDLCEKASTVSSEEERKKLMTFVVVGGGPTGIELVSEISGFIKETLCSYYRHTNLSHSANIILINNTGELLQYAKPRIRKIVYKTLTKIGVNIKLNTEVKKIESDHIETNEGDIYSSCVVWCAGVVAQKPIIDNVNINKNGRIETDQYLRVQDQDNIFVLGDVSNGYPMLAQVAVKQAKVLAHNIKNTIKGKKLRQYKNSIPGFLISLGQWRAAGTIYGFSFSGPIMWWLWRTIYLFKFISWRKRFEIAVEWTIDIFTPRDIVKPR